MFAADHYAISVGNIEESIVFYEKLEFCVIKDYQAEDGSVRIVQMKNVKQSIKKIFEMSGVVKIIPIIDSKVS